MDVVTIVVMVAAFVLSAIPEKKPLPKIPEQELGEAIGKYLTKGIKIQVEISDRKE